MEFKDIKVGMKLRLKTQEINGHRDYYDYGWKIGDIVEVVNNMFELKNLRTNDTTYCIPDSTFGTGKKQKHYADFFEPVNQTLKELIEGKK